MTEAATPPQIALAYAGTDRHRAEALARVLTSLGYRIAPQPLNAGSIDESAALLALWSPAAVNSGPINALASQAALQRKLVCVRSGAPHPPAAFSLVSLYDLSSWTGSGDSAPLRGLIDHLAQMAPPPRPRAQAPAVAATPFFISRIAAPAMAPEPPRAAAAAPAKLAEPLSAEAIAWRQIQHSDDPRDFEEHLEIFGEQAVYAPYARERLRLLQSQPRAAVAQPVEAAPQPKPAAETLRVWRERTAAPPKPSGGGRLLVTLGAAGAVAAAIAAATYFVVPNLTVKAPEIAATPVEATTPVVAATQEAPAVPAAPIDAANAEIPTPPEPVVQGAVQAPPARAAADQIQAAAAAASEEVEATRRIQAAPNVEAVIQPIAAQKKAAQPGLALPKSLDTGGILPPAVAPSGRPAGSVTTNGMVAVQQVDFGASGSTSDGNAEPAADSRRNFKRMDYKAAPE